MNIGLTIPTKNRVDKVRRLVESVKSSLKPNSHIVHFCLAINILDPSIKRYILLSREFQCNNIKFHFTYLSCWRGLASAFNSICKNLPKEVETITMFGDDMILPQSQDVFDKVEDFLIRQCAPHHIGVIWFNDDTPYNFSNRNPIAINGFVHRNWYEALGFFVPEEFIGDYSDNWLSDVARAINKYQIVRTIKIPHLHCTFNPLEADTTASEKLSFEKKTKYTASVVWKKQLQLMPNIVRKLNNYMVHYGK